MNKLLFFWLALVLPGLPLFGQSPPGPALRLHYVGHYFFHPGLSLAWEQPVLAAVKQKEGKRPGEVWHALFAAPQLGFYTVAQNHQGLFAGADLGYKTTRKRGWEYQVFATANYLRTYLANPTFVQQADGSFAQQKGASRGSLMLGAGLGLGKNYFKSGKAPLSWSVRLLLVQPGQATSAMGPSLSFGISYHLTNRT